jgi:probable selenium-dependent hydroxylase accessory protein YqeC
VREGLEAHGHVFVGRDVYESGKVQGISPSLADSLYYLSGLDYLITEADGAAGRPVKVPDQHEPMIPPSATVVIAMMGLEAMGKPLGQEAVFRLNLFQKLTGLERGDHLTPEHLAMIFKGPEGLFRGSPEAARRVAFLNKLDRLANYKDARTLADILVRGTQPTVDLVVAGSVLKRDYLRINKGI